MNSSDLVFVGIKGSVVALDRVTGGQVWATRLNTHMSARGFVNVVVQNGELLATSEGEVFCLDRLTGNIRWHNPLKGYGTGLATIATESNSRSSAVAAMAEAQQRDQASAAAAVAATG